MKVHTITYNIMKCYRSNNIGMIIIIIVVSLFVASNNRKVNFTIKIKCLTNLIILRVIPVAALRYSMPVNLIVLICILNLTAIYIRAPRRVLYVCIVHSVFIINTMFILLYYYNV